MTVHAGAALPLAVLAAGAPAGDRSSATADGFSAVQALTTDPQGFVRDWNRPGAHVDLQVTQQVRRGQPISAFIMFKGCRPAADGACHIRAEVEVVGSGGRLSGPKAGFRVWDRAPLDPPLIARSDRAATIAFDASDPPGRYVFRTTVTDQTDRAAPVSVRLETPVVLDGR